ncbi:hypothetical protein RyT2_17220 [Pseudolactococcus yaeyamensis]
MEEQQEIYRILKNVPRQVMDVIRVLSFLTDELKGLTSATHDSKRVIRKEQAKIQKEKVINYRERQTVGEKSMSFMATDGKMIAQPQSLSAETVNLGQLKNHLEKYQLQFHIEPISSKEFELHFFAKDKELAAKALERAMVDLVKDPSQITAKDLEGEFEAGKDKQAKIREQIAAQKADKQVSQSTKEAVDKKVADKVTELSKSAPPKGTDGFDTSLFGSAPPVDELVR